MTVLILRNSKIFLEKPCKVTLKSDPQNEWLLMDVLGHLLFAPKSTAPICRPNHWPQDQTSVEGACR